MKRRVAGTVAFFASFLVLAAVAAPPAPSATPAATPAAASAADAKKMPAPAPAVATSAGSAASTAKNDGLMSANEALGDDVLDLALSWNSAKYAKPTSTFRAGGVTKRKVDADTVSKVGGGFKVSFASGSQVTTPAVYGGMLFVSGGFSSRELYAFDARSGKPVWALDLEDDGPSAPACADGVCVINTESCTLFVVNAKTGDLVWSKWLGDPLMSAATISKGRVFASYPVTEVAGEKKRPDAATHALAAFDLKTGKVLWQKWIDGDVISSPVAVGGKVWASTFSGTVYEMEQATGKIVSARRSKATSAPVVVAGNLYFSKRDDIAGGIAGESIVGYGYGSSVGAIGHGVSGSAVGHGSARGYVVAKKAAVYLDEKVQASSDHSTKGKGEDAQNGFAGGAPEAANAGVAASLVGQASVSTLQAHQGSRILSLPGKNVSSMGDEVICTDAATGKKLWTVKVEGDVAKAGGFLATAPVAAGGSVLVGTVAGEVLQIDPKSGAVKKRWKVGAPVRAQPVVQDGWIYAGTADGRLIAIDTGDKSLTGWSQWGGDAERSSVAK